MYRLKTPTETYAEYEKFDEALQALNYLHGNGVDATVVKVVKGVEYRMQKQGSESKDILRDGKPEK